MHRFSGKTVYKGIAIGPVVVLKKEDQRIKRRKVTDTEEEILRLEKAGEQAQHQLQRLYEKAANEVGEEGAAIFEAHRMLLEEEGYLGAIRNRIRTDRINAEYAVEVTGDHLAERFADMEDACMKARAVDIRDISSRLVRNLTGQEEIDFAAMEPSILVAEELSPGEMMQIDPSKILAVVTVHGSFYSHASILARMRNIPALIDVPIDLKEIRTGRKAVADGFQGEVFFEPTEKICLEAEKKMRKEQERQQLLQALKGKENVTLDGHKIDIYANIGAVGDVEDVLENDAGGIGLFRSEFLYLGKADFPTEEEQFLAYKQILQNMEGKKVVIRTLDLGADKQPDYFRLEKEENPAMGCRGIRICLKRPDIFKTQLRALLRAAMFGNLSVLYPMITSVQEVLQIYKIVNDVKAELEQAGVPFKVPEQGIMVETPAAVLVSDELAELVDFFSIGTNDLTQYTLAADRQNSKLEEFYDPHHKAILRMIRMAVNSAHKYGKRAGICGELAADLDLTETLVRMGVDELSVEPSMVLKIRKTARGIAFSD